MNNEHISSEIDKSTINEKIESTNNVFNEFREFSDSLFSSFWSDYINFKTVSKMIDFTKTSLGVKPPLKISMFRHNMKFSRSGVLMGGWTLVPTSKVQPWFHQDLPAKHTSNFIFVPKS